MIGELAALGAALSWTFSAVLYKEALLKTKPISANIVRLTCTSAILVICLIVLGKLEVLTNLPLNAVFLACISGIIGLGFGDTLYMYSLKLIGVARAVPITCIYPLFNLLWSILLLEETITASVVLGALIIVLGIAILSRKEKKENLQKIHKGNLIKGVASALVTALMWSISITLMDMAITLPETSSIDNALAINTIRTMAIAVLLLVAAPIIDRNFGFLKMQRKTLAMLIFGGIIALGLGWFFLAYSFVLTSEARAVPISSTTPLFSTLSATILLHEHVTSKNVVGAVMVVAGIFLIFTF
ncbi:MAG: DMT family transporter [Candidatus Bathycorpusculaceae bacterium]